MVLMVGKEPIKVYFYDTVHRLNDMEYYTTKVPVL